MKNLLLIVPFLVGVFLPEISFGQNWEKYIDKYNAYYEKGDYEKALATNEKFKAKTIKKLGPKNKYIPFANMNDAKLSLQQGELVHVEQNLTEAIAVSKEVNTTASKEHAAILLESIFLYKELENYQLAYSALNDFYGSYSDQITADQKVALLLIEIKALKEIGFYNEAIKKMRDNFPFFMERVNQSSLKKDEQAKRNREFVQMVNLVGEIYIDQGNYQRADSALKSNTSWLEKNLNKKDREFAWHELLIARSLDKQRNYKEAEKYFEDAYDHAKSIAEPHDRFALEVQRDLILAYARYGKKSRYQNELRSYESLVRGHYSPSSVFMAYAKLLVVLAEMTKDNYQQFAQSANAIINDQKDLPTYHTTKLIANHYLYELAVQQKDRARSRSALDYEKEIKANLYGTNSPQYHLSLIEEAIYNINYTNRIRETDSVFNSSWTKIVKPEIHFAHPSYNRIQKNLAYFYELTDKYDLAKAALENSFDAVTRTYNRTEVNYANEIVNLANLQINIGEYSRAEKYLDLALEVLYDKRKEGNNMIHYVNAMESKARLYAIKGMYDEAEDIFRANSKLIKKAELDKYDLTDNDDEIARIYLSIGMYAEASEILEKALKKKEGELGADNKSLIPTLIPIGKMELIKGDYTNAEKTALRTLGIAEKVYGKNSSNKVECLMLLSDINSTLGDFESAEKNLTEALNIHRAVFGEKQLRLAEVYAMLALAKLNKNNNVKDAKAYFEKAKGILLNELDKTNPLYAELLKDQAYVFIANAEYGQAFTTLLEAEKIWLNKVGKRNNINAASIYVFLGDIYYMLKNYNEAEVQYKKAKDIYVKYFSPQHPEYVKTLAKESKVLFMKGKDKESMKLMEEVLSNYDEFIKYYFPALSEREKARFWNTIKGDYEFYNTLVLKSITSPDDRLVGKLYDNALNTKALLLNSSIKMRENILKSGDEELIKNYNDWLESKELLTDVLSMSVEQLINYRINEDSLVRVVELLEKDLSERSELFSSNTERTLVSWEDVKDVLKENEVAVEMIRFRYFNHVFTDSILYAVVTLRNERNRDRPELILLSNGKDLESKYFQYYKNMIVYQLPDNVSYGKYWKNIDQKISDNATVYLSPDGVYNQINLEAIMLENGKYVLDNSNIVLVSNTKDLVLKNHHKANKQKENRALMFGDPDFYVSTSPTIAKGKIIVNDLPGTEKEVNSLHDLLTKNGWKTDYYLQLDASEDQVKALNNPRVFHIATHGFYTPNKEVTEEISMSEVNEAEAVENPLLRSGLMLRGAGDVLNKTKYNYNIESGILTAYEAMNLNLDYTDLVVLSACETGVGDVTAGEGVYGLQRAFLVAGAKTMVMSLFKVSDEATNELMVTFYRKWFETGEMRKSFIDAKKEIRNKYQDPIYWGAFIMFGLE